MDLFKYMFDTEWKQRKDIEDIRDRNHLIVSRSRRNHYATAELKSRVAELEQEIGELALINKALLCLLNKKGVTSEAEIEATIREVDLQDGVEDGRITKTDEES